MPDKHTIKLIQSLRRKKVRDSERLYVIEGDKLVKEFLSSGMSFEMLIAKPEFISSLPKNMLLQAGSVIPCSYEELKRVSTLTTPHNALAVLRMPDKEISVKPDPEGLSLFLDSIQDPGNLGTIIRAAAWFGVRTIVCTPGCVDVYNPKVIQATMGAILHVDVEYTDPFEYLKLAKDSGIITYGTVMKGENIYSQDLETNAIIVVGNESKGISPEIIPFLDRKISIPRFASNQQGIDSLNAGMAVSVVLSEFRRGLM